MRVNDIRSLFLVVVLVVLFFSFSLLFLFFYRSTELTNKDCLKNNVLKTLSISSQAQKAQVKHMSLWVVAGF